MSNTMNCDQCEMLSINGHACHESGCPNRNARSYILLGTGGPATRIVCELDDGEPTRARLQAQDWGTPWTDYIGGDSETLLTYCRCFYFGEG